MKAADILLNYRASPSIIEPSSGVTSMSAAFSSGNTAMSELLMKFGGNPDAKDKSGKTARSLAKKNKELQKLISRFDDLGAEGFEVWQLSAIHSGQPLVLNPHACADLETRPKVQEEPGSWEKFMHEERNLPYYHNEQTGVTQYSIPISCSWVKGFIDGTPVYTNSITHQTRWTTPRALAWKYLHNTESNTCALCGFGPALTGVQLKSAAVIAPLLRR